MALSYPQKSDEKGRIDYWMRQIEWAQKYYQPYHEASQALINQYNMDPTTLREQMMEASKSGQTDPAIRVKANIVFGWIDQSIANIAANDPKFRIKPFNREGVGSETVVARISDYWYRETGQLETDRRVLLDAFLNPYGVAKIGWHTDIDATAEQLANFDPTQVHDDPEVENSFLIIGQATKVLPDQDHENHNEFHTQLLQTPELSPEVAMLLEAHIAEHDRFDKRGDPARDTNQKWEAPFAERWEPRMFLVDPLAKNGIKDARWIAFEWVRPLDEVKADPTLKNTADIEPQERAMGAPDINSRELLDDFAMVRGYEIWARNFPTDEFSRNNLVMNVVKGHDKFLRDDNEWPFDTMEDYPVEVLAFHQGIDTWFNKPSLVLSGGDSIQSLIHEMLDANLSVARKQKNLFLFDPEYVDEDELTDLLNQPDMSAFPVDGLVDSNSRVVIPIDFGDVNPDKGDLIRVAEAFFDRAAGTPQPGRSPDPDSATEANIIDRRVSARENARAELFSGFQIRKASKFWQLTTEFRPDRIFIIDPKAELYVNVDDSVAKGQYRFEIDITSASAAQAVERKQWLDLFNLLSGSMQTFSLIYNEPPNLARVLELLLVRGYQIQDPDTIIPFLEQARSQFGAEEAARQVTGQGAEDNPEAALLAAAGGDNNHQAGPLSAMQLNSPTPSGSRMAGNAARTTNEGQ